MPRISTYLILFSGLVFITGCKTRKEAAKDNLALGNKKTADIVNHVIQNESKLPHTISYKSATEIVTKDKTTSFKATVRMVPDSVIWISISAYKYEVARILATPDSLKFFIRTEKKYYIGDYSYVSNQLNVDFEFKDIQRLLLGQSMGLEQMDKIKRNTKKKFYVLSSVNTRQLKKLSEGKGKTEEELVYSNWVHPKSFHIAKIVILDLIAQKQASIEYSEFEKFDTLTLPTKVNMDIIAKDQVRIISEYSKVHVNKELKFSFSISDKYDPLDTK